MRSRARSARMAGALPRSVARNTAMSRLAILSVASGALASAARRRGAAATGASAASSKARTTRQATDESA